MFLGRHDYAVRSVHVSSREETWNATWARLVTLAPGGSGLTDFLQGRGPAVASASGLLPSADRRNRGAGLPRLAVGADNTLQAFDPGSGYQKWRVVFRTPPVAVYTPQTAGKLARRMCRGCSGGSSGSSRSAGMRCVCLPAATGTVQCLCARHGPHLRMRIAAGANLLRALSGAATSHKHMLGRRRDSSSVLIGEHRGSLYALPAEHMVLSQVRDSWCKAASAVLAVHVLPAAAGSLTRLPCVVDPAATPWWIAGGAHAGGQQCGQQQR